MKGLYIGRVLWVLLNDKNSNVAVLWNRKWRKVVSKTYLTMKRFLSDIFGLILVWGLLRLVYVETCISGSIPTISVEVAGGEFPVASLGNLLS